MYYFDGIWRTGKEKTVKKRGEEEKKKKKKKGGRESVAICRNGTSNRPYSIPLLSVTAERQGKKGGGKKKGGKK